MIPQSEISTKCREQMALLISMKKRSSNLRHIRTEIEHYTSDLPNSATFGTRVQALGNDLGMTPRQYLCKVETDRREARRIKKGDIRIGDTVTCAVCGYSAKTIANHLMNMHGLTVDEYKGAYGVERVISSDVGFVSGSENPAFNHGGALSPWSQKFLCGYDADKHDAFKAGQSEFQKTNAANVFRREFYDTDVSYTVAQTRDLDYFTRRYGDSEGKKRHALKTKRWAESFRTCNFSMVSQKLFSEIDMDGAYFATKPMAGMEKYKNKEYVFSSLQGTFRLDYYVPHLKAAIEFDGDYWHSEARVNPEREARREKALTESGIRVLRIREQDYKRDKLGTIQKCKKFLNQYNENSSTSSP